MSIDYKDTLNLPQTDFPMKADLPKKEPEILNFWEKNLIYKKVQEKNKGKKKYILHDGPPYANGNIHIGHALNKILKDIIIKYKSMKGYYSPFVPGWDCHGLPIEIQVDKELGGKKELVEVIKKRHYCRQYAERFVNIQREEFKRLGVFGDWNKPYLTMSYDYEASILKEFYIFVKNGYVYKGKKPVHWCPSCVTALAEAEVEYKEKESPSIFVRFPVLEEDVAKYLPKLKNKKVYIVIWTTTPWTLPANLALAINPEIVYSAVKDDNEVYIIAEGNFNLLKEKGIIKGDIVLKINGNKLEGIRTYHPFINRESKVILGDFVSTGEGSGIVHIAPGHGEEDYEIGLKYGLNIYAPVDDKGRFTEDVPEFQGVFVFKADDLIIEELIKKGNLLGSEKIRHSYPHCWRCKRPVIFRATSQWFISMEKNNLRLKCLKEIERVEWIPSWGRERIYLMVSNRPDWCLSRQRSWGVPIALITCEVCGEIIKDDDLFNKILRLTEEEGADMWYKRDIDDLIQSDLRCSCGSSKFKKEMDILDVWFDSGVSHACVLERDKRLSWPADLYLEGSDQHRGWFQSSLLASVGTRNRAPYNTVLTHGFVVDGQGRKMSKSMGNVIAPQDFIKENGAEILRLWVSAENYRDDIRLSKEITNRLTDAYRKIRNTGRFLLGNISDFDGKDYSDYLLEIDRWALSKLQGLIGRVTEAYESFDFYEVFHLIHNFCVIDMSSFYLDILKDRLYTFKKESKERRAAQWVLLQILLDLTRLMAPILSFTSEEIWQSLKRTGIKEDLPESVFLSQFPNVNDDLLNTELEDRWEKLIKIRDEANKAMEIKRKEKFIGNSLEAKLTFYLQKEEFDLLDRYKDFLPYLFIVSEVEINPFTEKVADSFESSEISGLFIKVSKASGQKCQRCWNWSVTVGKFIDHPDICERCHKAIS
jgi:isoleucyl-tRNA synthetase